MNILFIHQNFPAQFKYLAPSLVSKGHKVKALLINNIYRNTRTTVDFANSEQLPSSFKNVDLHYYNVDRATNQNTHPWCRDFETKVIRAEGCYKASLMIREDGFIPDLIISHHGWGESMFVKDVWPNAVLALYCEFFYLVNGADQNFDPEFSESEDLACRIQLKNLNNILHLNRADAGISPTSWQASSFPSPFREKISVIHDGIDTNKLSPNPMSRVLINNKTSFTASDEIITFVNRNLEPYRGFHIFMRSLPELLKRKPNAHVFLIGGDSVSYGKAAPHGQSWKQIFINEVKPLISDKDWSRVYFLGQIPYECFINLLQISSAHVYLTYPFVLSWSLLEAMSIGCPIVASNTQPLLEVIENNHTGRLIDFFDVDGLTEAIIDLINHPQDAKRLGINARKFVIENYDLNSVCLPKQIEWVHSLI